jgi:hypothetical protein
MKTWKRAAIACIVGAGLAVPVYAADGDALQSHESARGSGIERNPVTTPLPSTATIPVPMWNGGSRSTATGPRYNEPLTASPQGQSLPSTMASPSSSSGPSAAQESRATGNVDAQQASPPRTGSDVQAGDMGPSNAKSGSQ